MKYVLTVLALVLASCGGDEPPPEQKKPPEGRAETRSIRNTEAVGYSGKAIADKVDAALNKNDENNKKVEQESTEQP
jgi:hypothetical protein